MPRPECRYRQGNQARQSGPIARFHRKIIQGVNFTSKTACLHCGINVLASLEAFSKQYARACCKQLSIDLCVSFSNQTAASRFEEIPCGVKQQKNVTVCHPEDDHQHYRHMKHAHCFEHMRPGSAQNNQDSQCGSCFRPSDQPQGGVRTLPCHRPVQQRHTPQWIAMRHKYSRNRNRPGEYEHAQPYSGCEQAHWNTRKHRQPDCHRQNCQGHTHPSNTHSCKYQAEQSDQLNSWIKALEQATSFRMSFGNSRVLERIGKTAYRAFNDIMMTFFHAIVRYQLS